MYVYAIEELSRATVQGREAEASRVLLHAMYRDGVELPLRSRLARTLVHLGLCLDHRAGDLAASHSDREVA